ncbi:MAG TPA: TatD family hydrolase [Polyangiaceae bacterium]
MGLFDVHAHLTHPEFAADLPAVLARAKAAGLTRIISNGLNLVDNAAVLELSRREPMVRPALGLYPVDAVLPEMRAAGIDYPREGVEHTAIETIDFIRAHIDSAIAVGEVGLDGYWVPASLWSRQDEVFETLVRLAISHDKPLIVHSRKREPRALELLEALGAQRVLWHCFGSKLKLVRRIVEKGHYVSIPANARRSESFSKMLQTLPRTQLLLETDCPYLPPRVGERNEPSATRETLSFAAELWNTSLEATLGQFESNYERLFREAP